MRLALVSTTVSTTVSATVSATALALMLAMTSTHAQQRTRQPRAIEPPPGYLQPYAPPSSGRPDPSFGNRIGIDNERANGRCVVDLGYGRWENC